ncbi:MAG: hypothetical protein AAGH46_09575, partial [Bacteroidota bacterium]
MRYTKFLYYCLLCVLINNCVPDVVNNTRIAVIGSVVDQNGNALGGAKIQIFAGSISFLLGEGESQTSGEFLIPSFYSRFREFEITIRNEGNYSSFRRQMNTTNFTPDNFELNLGQITLREFRFFNFQ